MAEVVDKAILQDAEYLKALKRIESGINRMTSRAEKEFAGVSKSAHSSGIQIGAVSGVVSALTTEFINLGKQAVGVLIDIAKEGTQTALGFDVLRSRLLGIFKGSKPAAEEAFDFIQEKSKELGIDLGELAGAFLPKVESLEQFERVAKIATALARSDPEQGSIGARIAIIEALSGTFTSLQRRFEIPKSDIEDIKEAFDTRGMEGFIETLEDVLARSGKSFDDLKNTAQASIDRVNIQFEQLKGALGVPIVEELKEQFDALFDAIEGNEDDLLLVADTFGRVLAHIVEIVGSGLTDFLTNLDTEQAIELGEALFGMVADAKALVEVLAGANFPDSFIESLTTAAEKLSEVLQTATKVSLLFDAGLAQERAESAKSEEFGATILGGGITSKSPLAGILLSEQQLLEVVKAGQEAYNKVILDGVEALDTAAQASEDNAAATDARKEAIAAATDADGGAADALLGEAAALREAEAAAEELAGAQAKVNEAMEKAALDHARALEDIDIKAERKRLDIAIEFAQKREDAAKDNLEKLADLRKKNAQDIQDAATDLSRAEEDIARKFAEERIDLEKEQRQKRVDVERDYRLKLQDIQRQFLLDADEAEQKRDAVAFLRAIKERDKQIQEAQIARQRDVDELKINGEQRKEELRAQQAREIEEARIANERKLEDLRLNLERQIEAQNTAYAQQLEDIAIGEQRKNEEAARARERDIEDAKKAYDRKLADLQEALAAELALIEEFAAAAAAAQAAASSGKSNKAGSPKPKKPSTTGGSSAGFGSNPGTITGHAFGGLVNRGQAVPVGERGPELFVPSANGRIIPSNQLLLPSFTPKTAISNITNSQQSNVNLGVLDPDSVGVLNEARMRNIVLSILAGL